MLAAVARLAETSWFWCWPTQSKSGLLGWFFLRWTHHSDNVQSLRCVKGIRILGFTRIIDNT